MKHININIYHLSSLFPIGHWLHHEKENFTVEPQATAAVVPAGTIIRVATANIAASLGTTLALLQCYSIPLF
jgi:hypothetical protein